MYLLDTNVWSVWMRRKSPSVVSRAQAESEQQTLFVSSIVRAELIYGAIKSIDPSRNLEAVRRALSLHPTVPFDDACCDAYGVIRANLESTGRIIGSNDLLIAATEVAHKLTLVTHNVREFSRVSDLSLEDWQTDLA